MGVDTKEKIHHFLSGAVLGVGLARAAGLAAETTAAARASRAGTAATEEALAKSSPSTSKTMNIPKGTNVITSNNSGVANATSNVDRVTIQKSPVRISAGVQSNAAAEGAKAAAKSMAQSVTNAKNAQNMAKIVTGVAGLSGAGKKKKK